MASNDAPDVVFGTMHGGIFGAVFPSREKATRYPGPRMLELAERDLVTYIQAAKVWSLIGEWNARLSDIENEGARMELEAAIGDLEEIVKGL